jgi:hypothetical protein
MILSSHASARFNGWLAGRLGALACDLGRAVGPDLVAVVLGGGYGRGEGGVQGVGGIERPYNDVDLFVVMTGARRWPQATLERLARLRAPDLGVPVDIGRPLTVPAIEAWPAWLMWHELLHGHVVLYGPPDVLTAHASAAAWGPPPAIEATRLLLNRGAGLLWAWRVVRGVDRPTDPDFVRRNRLKAEQALGDAWLIAHGRHRTALDGRADDLAALRREHPDVALRSDPHVYRQALAFKRRPDTPPLTQPGERTLAETAERWRTTWLHLEAGRTGRAFADAQAYAAWDGLREPGPSTAQRLANVARGVRLGRPSWRHPREALYRELPLLLRGPDADPADWAWRGARFLDAWRRFQ